MSRKLGLLFMTVGVVGIVVSLLLIPAIWIGRAMVEEQVASLAVQVRMPLEQAESAAGMVRTRLETVRGTLDQVVSQAQSAAGAGSIEQQVAARLLGVIDQTVTPQYERLRAAYVDLRDRLTLAMQAATALRRLMPGIPWPALPTDDLTAVDSQLQALDTSLQQMRADLAAGTLPDSLPGVDSLRRVADGVQQVDARLDAVIDRVNELQARIQQGLAQVDQAQDALERLITIAAIGLSVVCLYVALLHAALVALGRVLRRPTPTPTLAAADAAQDAQSRRLMRPETVA